MGSMCEATVTAVATADAFCIWQKPILFDAGRHRMNGNFATAPEVFQYIQCSHFLSFSIVNSKLHSLHSQVVDFKAIYFRYVESKYDLWWLIKWQTGPHCCIRIIQSPSGLLETNHIQQKIYGRTKSTKSGLCANVQTDYNHLSLGELDFHR